MVATMKDVSGKRTAVVTLALTAWSAATSGAAPLRVSDAFLAPIVEVEAPARYTGVLRELPVAEGARVEQGAILASLDARAAELAVVDAEAQRDQAQYRLENELRIEYAAKALEVARAELRRSEESIEKFAKSISQSQLDVERLTVEKLQLELRQAERERELARFDLRLKEIALDAARLQRDLHDVRAPFAGVVTLVRARAGEWVQPGTVVCRVVAVDRLRAEAFVDAAEVDPAWLDAPVEFVLDADRPARCDGTLKFVSPEVDPVTGQVRIWAEIDNAGGALRPGQRGTLEVRRIP